MESLAIVPVIPHFMIAHTLIGIDWILWHFILKMNNLFQKFEISFSIGATPFEGC
jgi:hypothetical protein